MKDLLIFLSVMFTINIIIDKSWLQVQIKNILFKPILLAFLQIWGTSMGKQVNGKVKMTVIFYLLLVLNLESWLSTLHWNLYEQLYYTLLEKNLKKQFVDRTKTEPGFLTNWRRILISDHCTIQTTCLCLDYIYCICSIRKN